MLLLIPAVAFAASLLTLFSGFGLGTILMPVIALFFPVTIAVALTALVHLLNNLFKLAVLWPSIAWPIVWRFGVPALLAAIPGAWLLTSLGAIPLLQYQLFQFDAAVTPVKLVIGLLLILFALTEWLDLGRRFNIDTGNLVLGGVLSGFFGGLSGHQGAFRSAFLLQSGLDARAFVACNAAIATLVDLTRLVVYGLNLGLLLQAVNPALLLLSTGAALLGVVLGKRLLGKIQIKLVRNLVGLMLVILGTGLCTGIL
jgi:uncharacterized protein